MSEQPAGQGRDTDGPTTTPDEAARTDHDDPDMYRHRRDPEPDAGEGDGS